MLHKKNYCVILFIIIAAAAIGCKKYRNGGGYSSPPQNSKRVIVSTIAGDGTRAYENGPALSAKFSAPYDVAVTADGTIYIVDFDNNRIRKLAFGHVSTYAGSGGFAVVNGNGESAQFKNPFLIEIDTAGNLFDIDWSVPFIRKITPNADVTTYAGAAEHGFMDGSALMAQFELTPEGIVTNKQGDIYISDTYNGRIRKISRDGVVSTVAGTGAAGFKDGDAATAQFKYPGAITIDPEGNLYVADLGNLRIRKITPNGIVSTYAGSGIKGYKDGSAETAQFNLIAGMVSDSEGNIYVTDDNRIRQITPGGVVLTIAGSTAGYADGEGFSAKFRDPAGLAIDGQGNIYVADINNNRIRKIRFE